MKMAKITVKLFTILASCVIIGCTTNTNSSSKECEEIIQKENSEKIDTATNDCAKLGMSRNVQSIKVFIYEAKENFDKFEKGELKEKGHYYIVFDKNGCLLSSYEIENENNNYYSGYDDTPSVYDNPYYNDNLDMDQQSIEFWNTF